MADGNVRVARPATTTSFTADLVAAQLEYAEIVKTTKGARSKYAPLDSVLDMLRPVLNRHGIAITQSTSVCVYEGVPWLIVHTTLRHEQDFIDGTYPVAPLGKPPQETGSALTYARRYALLGLAGVHPSDEDDDGEKGAAIAKPGRAASVEIQEGAPDDTEAKLMEFKAEALTRISRADTHETLDRLWRKIEAGAGFKMMEERLPRHANALRMAREKRIEEIGSERTSIEADGVPF